MASRVRPACCPFRPHYCAPVEWRLLVDAVSKGAEVVSHRETRVQTTG